MAYVESAIMYNLGTTKSLILVDPRLYIIVLKWTHEWLGYLDTHLGYPLAVWPNDSWGRRWRRAQSRDPNGTCPPVRVIIVRQVYVGKYKQMFCHIR